MTRYILHGGLSTEDNEKNAEFFREVVKGIDSPVKILMVYFARKEYKRKELFEIHKRLFLKNNPNVNIEFLYASEYPNEFRAQVNRAQVMFVEGGSSLRLFENLKDIPDIKDLIRSVDVYAGSSAGASLVSRYAYPSTGDDVAERLGLVDIKLINHFDENKMDRFRRLEKMYPEINIYALREFEYVVL